MDGVERRPGLIVARVLVGLLLVAATVEDLASVSRRGRLGGDRRLHDVARVRARCVRGPEARATAVLVTLFFALLVAVPVGWLLIAFATQASVVADRVQLWVAAGAQPPLWVTDTPWLAARVEELRESPLFGPAARG